LGAVTCPVQAITFIGPPADFWFECLKQRRKYERAQREQPRAPSI
jgi:hypothetical protein